MTERSPVSLAVDEVLADGAWHDVEEVLRVAAAKVPPGRAHRRAERQRQNALRRRGMPAKQPRRNGDRKQGVESGARGLAWETVRHRIRDGAVERDGDRLRRKS